MATKREIDLVCEIQRLAIQVNAQRKYSVWADFSGHVDCFEITVSLPWVAGISMLDGWGSGARAVYLSTGYKPSFSEDMKDVIEDKVSQLEKIKLDLLGLLSTDQDGIPL